MILTTNVKHTPLPWFAVNTGTKNEPMMSVKAARIAGRPPRHEVAICATGDSCQEMENANAAFIVQACNNHYELVEALANTAASLIAAHSLLSRGGKKAAPSDTMFEMMMADYWRAAEQARATLAKARGENAND